MSANIFTTSDNCLVGNTQGKRTEDERKSEDEKEGEDERQGEKGRKRGKERVRVMDER